MNKKEYYATIERWKQIYGSPPNTLARYRPEEIRATCAKCGKFKQHMSRHHKANDFFFANVLPDVYAKRYLEFHPEDTAKLCNTCHKKYHDWVRPHLKKMYDEYKLIDGWDALTTYSWCEKWRSILTLRFESWLKLKRRKIARRSKLSKKRTKVTKR